MFACIKLAGNHSSMYPYIIKLFHQRPNKYYRFFSQKILFELNYLCGMKPPTLNILNPKYSDLRILYNFLGMP